MGLALVEITMSCEEEFGVDISEDDWAPPEMQRVEGLYQLILRKLNVGPGHFCLSSLVFYRLRRALMDALGVSRQAVRPAADTAAVLPEGDLRPVWVALKERMGWGLVPLDRPRPLQVVRYLPTGLLALLVVGVVARLGYEWGTRGAVWGAVGALLPAAIAATALDQYVDRWTQGWRRLLPQDCGTVGGLVRATIRSSYRDIRKAEELFTMTREEVWSHLQHLIARELGVPLDKVTPEARWAEGLRAD